MAQIVLKNNVDRVTLLDIYEARCIGIRGDH